MFVQPIFYNLKFSVTQAVIRHAVRGKVSDETRIFQVVGQV